jgi:hydrogenase expression/formation protein HypE
METKLTVGSKRMQARNALGAGKLPVTLLRQLLARYTADTLLKDRHVVIGPGIGLDAAAIDMGSHYLIAKTDPITFTGEDSGAYALTINANDLATMGAVPGWFMVTILMPIKVTTPGSVSRIFSQLRASCRKLGVALCGGHTEVTDAVNRPVIIGCLLGKCRKSRLITTKGARVGDAVLLTKGIPIEAVSILARGRIEELPRRYSSAFLARCRRYLSHPGISVVRDASLAQAAGGVHAMHDPTEGGLSAALYELAEAANVGIQVEESKVRVLPEGARLCSDFGLNPWGAIASGALLICADPRREGAILRNLECEAIAATRIGTVLPSQKGVRMLTKQGRLHKVPKFSVDEITRLLSI